MGDRDLLPHEIRMHPMPGRHHQAMGRDRAAVQDLSCRIQPRLQDDSESDAAVSNDQDWHEKVDTAKKAWELGRRTMIPTPLRPVPGSRLTERQDQPGCVAGSLSDDSETY